MTAFLPSGGPGPARGLPHPLRRLNWLLLGGACLTLAGTPAISGEAPLPAAADCGGAEMRPAGFEAGPPAKYTRDAPSTAGLLQRILPGTGARENYWLTRNFGLSSSDDAATTGISRLRSAPRSSLPQLTLGQNSLMLSAAALFNQHFQKLTPWSGQSGSGVLYPINSTVGLFVDARTVMPNGSRYYGVARAGLRIMF